MKNRFLTGLFLLATISAPAVAKETAEDNYRT